MAGKDLIFRYAQKTETGCPCPGAFHHVMGRGIERTNLFRIDRDREDFLNRLANQCMEGNLIVYAWCLLSNHFHLLVRTGRQPMDSWGRWCKEK